MRADLDGKGRSKVNRRDFIIVCAGLLSGAVVTSAMLAEAHKPRMYWCVEDPMGAPLIVDGVPTSHYLICGTVDTTVDQRIESAKARLR